MTSGPVHPPEPRPNRDAASRELERLQREAASSEAEIARLSAEIRGWRQHALAVERENVRQRVYVANAAAEVHEARTRVEDLSSRLREVWADHALLSSEAARVHAEAARLAGLRIFRHTALLRSAYGALLRLWRQR